MKKQQIPNLDFQEHFLSSPEYCTAAQHFLFVRHVGLWCFQATLKIMTVVLALVEKKKENLVFLYAVVFLYIYINTCLEEGEERRKEKRMNNAT